MNRSIDIILAEDNRADVFLVRTALEEAGVSCVLHVFSDGEEVIRFLDRIDDGQEEACPQLVVLDLNLPRYSGEEILRRLRRSPRCGSAPAIVMTSSDSPKDREVMEGLGISHYFRKPADLENFLHIGTLVKAALIAQTAGVN